MMWISLGLEHTLSAKREEQAHSRELGLNGAGSQHAPPRALSAAGDATSHILSPPRTRTRSNGVGKDREALGGVDGPSLAGLRIGVRDDAHTEELL